MPALFETGVVVRAHPGQVRDLFAAQSRDPARAAAESRPRVLGTQTGPARAQEVTELVALIHASSDTTTAA